MSRLVEPNLEREVRERAGARCEYCHIPEVCSTLRHVPDHVIALQHYGPTVAENLALACIRCNARKGPNLSGVDPQTGLVTTLFNPRTQQWAEHFRWNGTVLIGLTDRGRTTIDVVGINSPVRVAARLELLTTGEFPRDFA
jgi:hypothetical protein